MSVIRVNKSKDFTVMSNCHFKEKEMSLKAKGLLSQMLSLPDTWDYSIAGLAAINKESIGVIRSTLDELKEFGYLVVTKKMPNETKSGRIEYVYDVFEKPIKQGTAKQGIEKQYLEEQYVEKHMQLNTNKSNTKILNTKNNIYNQFEILWDLYPRKQGKKQAYSAFERAIKQGTPFEDIKQGIEKYIRYINTNRVEPQFIKQGSTFFKNECWYDEFGGKTVVSESSFDIDDLDVIR